MPSSALANGETTRLPLWSVLATIVVCTAVKTSKADLFKNLQLPTMVLQVSISLSNTPTSLSLSHSVDSGTRSKCLWEILQLQ